MSYSRWGSSYWYTYWSVSNKHLIEDQLLEVSLLKTFTYRELKNDRQDCIKQVKNKCKKYYKKSQQPNTTDILELRGIMIEFIRDVEKDIDMIYYSIDEYFTCEPTAKILKKKHIRVKTIFIDKKSNEHQLQHDDHLPLNDVKIIRIFSTKKLPDEIKNTINNRTSKSKIQIEFIEDFNSFILGEKI